MSTTLRVLLIEDSEDDASLILHELRRGSYDTVAERVDTRPDLVAALQRQEWDLITCDYVLPGLSALAVLELIKEHGRDVPVIVASGEVGEEIAVSVMKAGAHDYVSKQKLARLVPAVERELREATSRRARERADEALRRSQANLQAILNNTLQSFVLLDRSGQIKAFNQIASVRSEILFLGPPLAEDRSIYDYVPKSLETGFRNSFGRALAGEVVVVETKIHDTVGAEHWFEFNYIPVREESDAISGVCFSILDITDHKRTEETLRQTQERLRTYIEQATDLIFTFDAAGKFTSVNLAVRETTGYSAAELIGKVAWDLVVPESVAAMQELLRRVLAGETVKQAEVEITAKDGRRLWLELRGRTIYESGRLIEIFEIARDVTERKSAEAELARFSAAVEQAAESIMITDPQGRIVYVNPACERMTGYSRAELYGQHPRMLNGRPDPEAERRFSAVLARGGIWQGSEVQRGKDGSLYEVEIVISPVSDSSGRIINYVGLARNATRKAT